MSKAFACFVFLTTFSAFKSAAQLTLKENAQKQPVSLKTIVLPQNFYNQHKGEMCKFEDRLQKQTGLPFFIRLGDKVYVDYLEQKPNAVRPGY